MLIGRETELDRVVGALRAGRATVIVGPPGMGKSTLAQTAATHVGPLLVGRAISTLTAVPLLLFRRQMGDAAASTDAPDVVADRLASTVPSALVLDDLQWADPASLEVVELLVGRVPLVATVRSSDPAADAVLDRLDLAGFERFELGGLSDEAAWTVARATNPGLDDDRLSAVVDTAQGSPLLLTEVSRGRGTSPTLISALLERLDRLSAEARQAMDRLSVLGRPASDDLLGPGVEELVRSGLARRTSSGSGSTVEAHHALLGELIVEDLGPRADQVRTELAERVDPFEAALLHARTGDDVRARAAALRAVDASATRRDRAEALLLAIEHAPDGDLDAERRVEATQLLIEFGRGEEALRSSGLHLMEQLVETGTVTPYDKGRLTGLAAYACWLMGDTRRFAALIEEAIDDLRGTRTEAEVRVLAASTIYATWVDLDGRSALDRAREAVRLADEIGTARGFARMRLAAVLSTAGETGWVERYQEAIDLADSDGDDQLRHEASTSLVLAQWTRGDAHAARRVAERELERTPRSERPQQWLVHAASMAILDLQLGCDPEQIVERLGPVLQEVPSFRTRPFMEAAVAISLADLGRDQEAADIAGGARSSTTAAQWQAVRHWIRAETAWLAGRDDDVVSAVASLSALGVGDYPPAVMARLLGAHVAVARGEPVTGPEPLALLPAWAGNPLEWRALVAESAGDAAQAVARYDEATAAYRDHDVRSALRCEWAAARALHGAGPDPVDHAALVERLMAVEEAAERHRYRALLRRIHPLLRRAGVARSAPSGRAPAGLTVREHEVLRRVAAGRTSVQIASELGIARDTVDDLVRSAMRRLGVRNRRAAVARLRSLEAGGQDRAPGTPPG